MNGFFAILVTLVFAGVATSRETVEARRGEKTVLLDEKSGFNCSRFERVILYESIDCIHPRSEICKYCSPKEKESGCPNKSCSTFSFDIGEKSVSVTPLNAGDGCYLAKIFVNDVVEKTLIIGTNGQLLSTPSPESDPPSWEPAESYSTKGTERLDIDGMPWVVAVGVAVGVAVVIAVVVVVVVAVVVAVGVAVGIAVGIAVGVAELISIYYRSKKSEAGDDAGDSEENNSCRESISGAGEDATGESFRMEDRIPCSTDEDRLTGVQIQDTSMGQESGRPGQHELLNDYKDSDYKYNRKNNKNDYEDSNYYSSDDSENITNSSDIISIY